MSTTTIPMDQHPTAADREAGLALINRCMPVFAAGMQSAALAELAHEAERLEGLAPSPVVKSMRLIVDQELSSRREVTDV